MKKIFIGLAAVVCCFALFATCDASEDEGGVFNSQLKIENTLDKFGFVGDGKTDNTKAFNDAVASIAKGGTLVIPAGNYVTGTIHLKSDITIILEKGANIIGTQNLDSYDHYKPTKDMSKYDTGAGTRNSNVTSDTRWTRALILGQNIENVTIKGEGTIDGQHLKDPQGEENMRGPHTVLIAESKDITLEGIHIRRAANYAVLGFELENAEFNGLDIEEGWDGIHIRGGEDLRIFECFLKTGDDAVAGGYWDNMTIKDCKLNSSCNGVRMIEPSTDVTIKDCEIYGPGKFPHITSGNKESIYGIVFEPGAWGYAPGHTEHVDIENVSTDRMFKPMMYTVGKDCTFNGLFVDGLTVSNTRGNNNDLNVNTWKRVWGTVEMKNIVIN